VTPPLAAKRIQSNVMFIYERFDSGETGFRERNFRLV
jgi:hypothetical protein